MNDFAYATRDHIDPDLANHTDYLDEVENDLARRKTIAEYASRED